MRSSGLPGFLVLVKFLVTATVRTVARTIQEEWLVLDDGELVDEELELDRDAEQQAVLSVALGRCWSCHVFRVAYKYYVSCNVQPVCSDEILY